MSDCIFSEKIVYFLEVKSFFESNFAQRGVLNRYMEGYIRGQPICRVWPLLGDLHNIAEPSSRQIQTKPRVHFSNFGKLLLNKNDKNKESFQVLVFSSFKKYEHI